MIWKSFWMLYAILFLFCFVFLRFGWDFMRLSAAFILRACPELWTIFRGGYSLLLILSSHMVRRLGIMIGFRMGLRDLGAFSILPFINKHVLESGALLDYPVGVLINIPNAIKLAVNKSIMCTIIQKRLWIIELWPAFLYRSHADNSFIQQWKGQI